MNLEVEILNYQFWVTFCGRCYNCGEKKRLTFLNADPLSVTEDFEVLCGFNFRLIVFKDSL